MQKEIKDLIEVSQFFGKNKDYTLAGGGNTSYKNDDHIWIKASGVSLATIDEDGFAVLDRSKVQIVKTKTYTSDTQKREVEVKNDLIAANIDPENKRRPSVETSFHESINYAFVVHMHPTLTNALMCSNNAQEMTLNLFGEEAMYITYDPGYPLFMKVNEALQAYRKKYDHDPKIIFLENHGIFVSSNNTDEIKAIYESVSQNIEKAIGEIKEISPININDEITQFMPALRMLLSDEKNKVLRIRHNNLHSHFYSSKEDFKKASLPFTPDVIVYCKADYLYIENSESPESIIKEFQSQLPSFIKKNGYAPKIIMIKNYGIIAAEDTAEAANITLDVYEDLLKISLYSEAFGGPHFLSEDEIDFVDNWEVENYRRKISKGEGSQQLFDQKICIVTGAAQGFGEGLADSLVKDNANVIVADLNPVKGNETTEKFAKNCKKNQVIFQQSDVSDIQSVSQLIKKTVEQFGGLDLFISNAGILHAGSLEEMTPEIFQLMTKVNYEGFFLCTKEASTVLKLQNQYKPDHFSDIVQINSKSGLQGSNKNFAYAGAKFGGIGLTQSFAMELAPFKIKVNAICPGNFFEGPLWGDPDKGLFVQYLKTGKVPGAKNIEDVKKHYESQVPLNRGCRTDDVMKAIRYIVDQKYETGQAIPVTGGQIMLK